MPLGVAIFAGLAALYALFLLWYGGRGKPLTQDEIAQALRALGARSQQPGQSVLLDEVRTLLANDDGHEFVMHNLVRYRTRALYPPGHDFGDDPRAADRRYGRAILWPLLRRACIVVFIARRSGSFIEPEGADPWHYVAMVRYRSKRDFLGFALDIERKDIVLHKWAAIEKTHVFPVQPMLSLVFVRGMVGVLLALIGTVLVWAT